jgi:hypothetical protein
MRSLFELKIKHRAPEIYRLRTAPKSTRIQLS